MPRNSILNGLRNKFSASSKNKNRKRREKTRRRPRLEALERRELFAGLADQVVPAAFDADAYFQNFDSGLPAAEQGWEYHSTNKGRIQAVNGGMQMDAARYGYSLNEAILHLDLEGRSGVELTLDHDSIGDENSAMPGTFTGHHNSDGIAVSNDGETWHRLTSLERDFADKTFDLDTVIADAGIDYTSDFQIKFQQYDNFYATYDGRAFDDIRIDVDPVVTPGESTTETIHRQNFGASKTDSWTFSSTATGRIRTENGRLEMDSSRNGSHSLNEAVLHLDLQGRRGVKLQFDHDNTRDENRAMPSSFTGSHNSDGVAISSDGVSWHRLTSLTSDFNGQEFDLDKAIAAAGIEYTSDFQIKFQQYDNYKMPIDGRAIDNVIVTATAITNTAPVGISDAYAVDEDHVLSIAADEGVLANDTDADGDDLTVSIADQPEHGTVTLNADGSFVYTPQANYHGLDSFTYTVADGTLASGKVAVSLVVNSVNDAPVLREIAPVVVENGFRSGDRKTTLIPIEVGDQDHSEVALSVETDLRESQLPAEVRLSGHGVAVTPLVGESGTFQVNITASDGIDSDRTSFSVTVLPGRNSDTAIVSDPTPPSAVASSARQAITTRDGHVIDYYQPGKPIAFIVNGYDGCCAYQMTTVIDALRADDVHVHLSDWNDIWGKDGSSNTDDRLYNIRTGSSTGSPGGILPQPVLDEQFRRDMADALAAIDPETPVILIGHSFGADSLLKVVAENPNRNVLLLGILDAVGAVGVRPDATVPDNVDYLFNRWQQTSLFPFNFGASGELKSHAGTSNQAEQSIERTDSGDSTGSARCTPEDYANPGVQGLGHCEGGTEHAIGGAVGAFFDAAVCAISFGTTCTTAVQTVGEVAGGALDNEDRPLLLSHLELPSDSFVQRQLVDAVDSALQSWDNSRRLASELNASDNLIFGEQLRLGESIKSRDGRFELVMQNDGNLVHYFAETGAQLWSSGTANQDIVRVKMRADGNLVLYKANGDEVSTKFRGAPGSRLVVRRDGNVVLYGPDDHDYARTGTDWAGGVVNASDNLIFGEELHQGQSVKSSDGRFELVLQNDGNLVHYFAETGAQLWSSGTAHQGFVRAKMRADGNLVLVKDNGDEVLTQFRGAKGSRLVVRRDGNVVLYGTDDHVYRETRTDWASGVVNASDNLIFGEELHQGQSVKSRDGRFELVMQNDGNLVHYFAETGAQLWSSGTAHQGFVRAKMRADGNLVLVKDNGDEVLTQFRGAKGSRLVVRRDGNVVLYGTDDHVYRETRTDWASGVVNAPDNLVMGEQLRLGKSVKSRDGRFELVLQNDGNLVLYLRKSGAVIKSWGTAHQGVTRAQMRVDGKFVLYKGPNDDVQVIFNGARGSRLVVRPDGNVVLYGLDDHVYGESRTDWASSLPTANGTLRQVSVASDGTAWALDTNGKVYRRESNGRWSRIPGSLSQISVGDSGHVWGVNSKDNIFRYRGDGKWDQITGKLKQVSVGSDGTVWGINKNNNIFRYLGNNKWKQVGGKFTQIAVGSSRHVWGIERGTNQLYRFENNKWEPMRGGLRQIAVGSDGRVWGVNSKNNIFRYRGSGEWDQISGKFRQVSVGNDGTVWAVNTKNQLMKYVGNNNWQQVLA